jgi:predicted site-specific integrase-resolvase
MDRLVATPTEVAESLGVSIDVVRDLKRHGRLPVVQLTRTLWGCPWNALLRWLDEEAAASLTRKELEKDGVAIDAEMTQ